MRRWNGWGDESVEFVLTPKAETLVAGQIGSGARQADVSLDYLVARVPSGVPPVPGVVPLSANGATRLVAVNVDPAESRRRSALSRSSPG